MDNWERISESVNVMFKRVGTYHLRQPSHILMPSICVALPCRHLQVVFGVVFVSRRADAKVGLKLNKDGPDGAIRSALRAMLSRVEHTVTIIVRQYSYSYHISSPHVSVSTSLPRQLSPWLALPIQTRRPCGTVQYHHGEITIRAQQEYVHYTISY
jgi:hypothetical protein